MFKENVSKVFSQASLEIYQLGKNAYRDYNRELNFVAQFYGIRFQRVVAAFVTLSPSVNLKHNFSVLRALCEFVKSEKPRQQLRLLPYAGYKTSLDRAYRYLVGWDDFETSLHQRSCKTRSFYYNILDPDNNKYVTVDRHIIGCYLGHKPTAHETKKVFNSTKLYREIAQVFIDLGREHGLLPCQVQAICWYQFRGDNL